MSTQQRLWLYDDEGLFPGPHHACQQHLEHAIRFGTGWSFHLPLEDDELLAEERIFCDQFGLTSGKICQCAKQERGGVWFGPSEEAMVERLKTMTSQPLEKGENPLHSRRYPYMEMSESMQALYASSEESARSKRQHEGFSQANAGRRMPHVASTGLMRVYLQLRS